MSEHNEKRVWLKDLSPLSEVNVGDWVEGIGDVTTHAQMLFLRKVGSVIIPKIEAELARLKKIVFGDEVSARLVMKSHGWEDMSIIIKAFQQAVKEAVEK